MRSLLAALIATLVMLVVVVVAVVLVADILYKGAQPPQSFIRFATYSALPFLIGTFVLARQNAKVSGSLLDRALTAATPRRPSTPTQRVFLLVALFGLAVCTLTVANFAWQGHSNFLDRAAFDPAWYLKSYFYAFWLGVLVLVVGCLGAFYYASTLGRLLRWIKGA